MSIVAVTLVVAALGASTFAWFTLSNRAEIGSFDAEVTAGEGIEVSIDGTNWYSTLPSSVINAFLESQNDGETPILEAVTTTNAVAFTKVSIQDVTGDSVGTLVPTAAPASSYISFTLFFRSQNATELYWQNATIGSEVKSWTPDTTFLMADGTSVNPSAPVNVRAANAVRVAVVGTVTKAFQVASGSVEGVVNSASNSIVLNGAIAYHNAKNPDNVYPELSSVSILEAATSFPESTVVGTPNGFDILDLNGTATDNGIDYNTGNLVVKVWIEGWDADTFNAILKEAINVTLSFEGKVKKIRIKIKEKNENEKIIIINYSCNHYGCGFRNKHIRLVHIIK
ncbi:conserved hypothetical protein [Paracholeplasma brassicae]|uniref:Uncharacterized protein n=1 Tax=Acholeplasma brassicae TaxID=61635 RepID=U4KRR1_9MOLU|nr:hypothetical protein [Paracholeplasma brassicae]CCV65968.1 conserved hypothetical protein [Paracholeplasma brassicae]